MLKHCPDLNDLQAMGTDGEVALINGWKAVFKNALHLQCDLHMRENIDAQLKEYGVDNFLAMKVLFNIFGRQIGHSKLKGLVDCTSEHDFDTFLEKCLKEWKQFGVPAPFLEYFREKAELIRKTMTADIRMKAGLGYPPELYRQQGNESVNNMIKREMSKKMSIVQFLNHLRYLVDQQQQEVEMAIFGRSNCYSIKPEYKHYAVSEGLWYQKSDE